MREPLRTSIGTPGFTVSDALLVRPFNGAADKFEADQVLQYDGNAIAPLLDPEYQANQPFDLQIFLIIYPDLYGEQPQMSLEILRNGHVVGRSALPFADKVRNEVLESSGMASIVGEQKHEFPYLATLRGVRFGPGKYQARVTVRQGRNVLSRLVDFRILGNAPGAVLASAGPASGAAASASSEDDADAEVTLPEVDPVHLTTGAAGLPAMEQHRLWEEATASALSYSSHLPNFRCRRETRRLTAPLRNADKFREADAIIEELTYENSKEIYRTLEVNGQKSSLRRDALKGVSSRGEFGSMLKSVFRPEVAAQAKWTGRAMSGGVLCDIFDVDVPVDKSNFILTFNLRQEIAAFHGRIFFDQEAGLVRRIVFEGSGLPKGFGLHRRPSRSNTAWSTLPARIICFLCVRFCRCARANAWCATKLNSGITANSKPLRKSSSSSAPVSSDHHRLPHQRQGNGAQHSGIAAERGRHDVLIDAFQDFGRLNVSIQ